MYNKIPSAGIGSKLLRLVPKVLAKRQLSRTLDRQLSRTLDELPKKEIKLDSSPQPVLKSYNTNTKNGQLDFYRDNHYKENMSGDINFVWSQRAYVTDNEIYIGRNKLTADDLERLGPAGVKKLIADLQSSSNELGEYSSGLGRISSQHKAFRTIYRLLEDKYPKKITLPNGRETTEGSEIARELMFGRGQDFYSYPYRSNPEYRVKTAEFNAKEFYQRSKNGIVAKRKKRIPEYIDEKGVNEYRAKVINGELTPEEESFLGVRNGDVEAFDRTYLGINPPKSPKKKKYEVKIGGVILGKELLKTIKVVPRIKNKRRVFYRMDSSGKADTSIEYTRKEVLDKIDKLQEQRMRKRQSWERNHYPTREYSGDRFKIAHDNAEQLEVTLAESEHRQMAGSNDPFSSMYPFQLNTDPVPYGKGGKLDLIKQFKQGGPINNKPETWEEYQKQNRNGQRKNLEKH